MFSENLRVPRRRFFSFPYFLSLADTCTRSNFNWEQILACKRPIDCDILLERNWGWLSTTLQSRKHGVNFSCFSKRKEREMIWIIIDKIKNSKIQYWRTNQVDQWRRWLLEIDRNKWNVWPHVQFVWINFVFRKFFHACIRFVYHHV